MGDPDVRLGDSAADQVREVPGLLQTGHAVGIPTVGCIEIPVGPVRESEERCCCAAPEVVVLADQVERLPRVGHGAGRVAEDPGLPSTVDSDRRR